MRVFVRIIVDTDELVRANELCGFITKKLEVQDEFRLDVKPPKKTVGG